MIFTVRRIDSKCCLSRKLLFSLSSLSGKRVACFVICLYCEYNKQIVSVCVLRSLVHKYKDIEQCRNSVANSFLFNQCVTNQHRYLAFVVAVDIVEIKRIYKSVLT